MRDRGFPCDYEVSKLGGPIYNILMWLCYRWVGFGHPGTDQQLILVGPHVDSLIRVIFRLLSSFYRLSYIVPSLDSFFGATEESDLFVIDRCAPSIFTKRWARSPAGITFERLLGGEDLTFRWGPNKEFTFRKRGNIPVILLCDGETIPIGFHHWRFKRRLMVARVEDSAPARPLTREELLATIFRGMTWAILCCHKHLREGCGVSAEFRFSYIWERTLEDVSGFPDPHFCFPQSYLDYVEDPSKEPLFEQFRRKGFRDWSPCFLFSGMEPLPYTAFVQSLCIAWLRRHLKRASGQRDNTNKWKPYRNWVYPKWKKQKGRPKMDRKGSW